MFLTFSIQDEIWYNEVSPVITCNFYVLNKACRFKYYVMYNKLYIYFFIHRHFCSFLQGLDFALSLNILFLKKDFSLKLLNLVSVSLFFVNIHLITRSSDLLHNELFLIARVLLKNLYSIFKIPNVDFSQK